MAAVTVLVLESVDEAFIDGRDLFDEFLGFMAG